MNLGEAPKPQNAQRSIPCPGTPGEGRGEGAFSAMRGSPMFLFLRHVRHGRAAHGTHGGTVVTRKTIVAFGMSLSLVTGCSRWAHPVAHPSPSARPPAAHTRPASRPTTVATTKPTSPVADLARYSPPPIATAAHLREIEPAIVDMAARAKASDTEYFSHHMGRAGDYLIHLMMERVIASDLPHTYRSHLIGDRLNYHPTTHV